MQPSFHPFSPTPVAGHPVVLATHEYAPFRGGAATYVREVAAAMHRLGLPVAVWTVDYRGRGDGRSGTTPASVPTIESSEGFPVVRLRSNGRLTPSAILRLAWGFYHRREELRGSSVILLSVGAQIAFFLLAAFGIQIGSRVTCVFYGSEVLRFQRNAFLKLLARRFYSRRVTTFAAITPYVADLLLRSGLLPDSATIELAPCALPGAFHVEQKSAFDTHVSFEESPIILTVARLHPRKGQLEVARALSLLPDRLRQSLTYRMVGVGDEHYRAQVEAACHQGGLRHEFLGGVDDKALANVYAGATIYAQASRTLPQSVEGFGMTFLEAGVHGCPVVAWQSGGVASAVLDDETGLLVPEGDLSGLAAAVAKLLTDPALRDRLGAGGRRHAASFDWDQTARMLCRCATVLSPSHQDEP